MLNRIQMQVANTVDAGSAKGNIMRCAHCPGAP